MAHRATAALSTALDDRRSISSGPDGHFFLSRRQTRVGWNRHAIDGALRFSALFHAARRFDEWRTGGKTGEYSAAGFTLPPSGVSGALFWESRYDAHLRNPARCARAFETCLWIDFYR